VKLFLYLIAIVFVAPVAIGILIGVWHQKGWGNRILELVGLHVINPIPTAWDWKFGQRNEHWLIIKMKDGTTFYGYFGRRSFASSDGERDIYVEQVFDFNDQGNWKPLAQGVWVQACEIATIEFMAVDR